MNPIDLAPEEFRRLSARVLEIAADYLQNMDARSIPSAGTGAEIERIYRTPLPETGLPEEALGGLADVAPHPPSPKRRFFRYGFGFGVTAAAAADLLCSILNQNVTAWRSAPAAVTLERTVVDWLAHARRLADSIDREPARSYWPPSSSARSVFVLWVKGIFRNPNSIS